MNESWLIWRHDPRALPVKGREQWLAAWLAALQEQDRECEEEDVLSANLKLLDMLFDQRKEMEKEIEMLREEVRKWWRYKAFCAACGEEG